jgi:hypothetical protein
MLNDNTVRVDGTVLQIPSGLPALVCQIRRRSAPVLEWHLARLSSRLASLSPQQCTSALPLLASKTP